MATATDSTTASLIPFPSDRARAPDPTGSLYDRSSYERCFVTAHVVQQFEDAPDDAVRAVLHSDDGDGTVVIARMLEVNRQVISFLRAALAHLITADSRIAAAADRVLAEAGL